MLLNLNLLVVLSQIYFSNKKTFKIPSNVDSDAMNFSMGINGNVQKLGETNKNEVHNDHHDTKLAQIHISPGNKYDESTLTSRGHSKSSESVKPDKGHPRKNLAILTSYTFQKYPINIRDRTEPHGY